MPFIAKKSSLWNCIILATLLSACSSTPKEDKLASFEQSEALLLDESPETQADRDTQEISEEVLVEPIALDESPVGTTLSFDNNTGSDETLDSTTLGTSDFETENEPNMVLVKQDSFVQPYRQSRRPQVSSYPLDKGGFILNAFYFVRSPTENWRSLSDKFYGRSDRANLLKKWNNGKNLQAGTLIYYNSAFRAEDSSKILPFALDFNQDLEAYIVQKGDSLSLIAKRRWGQAQGWREIAAINPQIAHPDVIQVGERLYLQPDFDTKELILSFDQHSEKSESTQDDSAVAQVEQVDQIDAGSMDAEQSAAENEMAENTQAQAPPAQQEEMGQLAMEADSSLSQADWMMMGGMLVVLLGLIAMFYKKARSPKEDSEDSTPRVVNE